MAPSPYIVLCVDDEPEFLSIVEELIKEAGYLSMSATNPMDALALIDEHKDQLLCIISDYEMPGANGFEFRKMTTKVAQDIPFIILSGYITREMALKGLDLGIAAFLNKPLEAKQLHDTIREKTKNYAETLTEKAALGAMFISESQELIEEIEPLLLALEGDPDNPSHLNSVFRLVHTVKGASGVLERPEITAFLHAFEDLLTRIKNGFKATPQAVTALLQAFDVLKTTIASLSQGKKAAFDFTAVLKLLKSAGNETNPASDAAGDKAEAGGAPNSGPTVAKASGILVPTLMLEEFMQLAGEITVIRNMVNKQVRAIEQRMPGDSDVNQLGILLDEMHKINGTMQGRIVELKKVQVSTVFNKLPRTVRDLSRQLNKPVNLEMNGGDVRVDTTIALALNNSLIHMVRNCVDHGLEISEVRKSSGKAQTGTIRLVCREEKDSIIVTLSDDGGGIDPERLRRKLSESGRLPAEQIASMSRQELLMQIFEPGFSTAAVVTDVSGRGVGMDMVRDSITKLKGRIDIQSEIGKGTSFTLSLPVPRSVVIISSLIVESAGRHFAVPQDHVLRLVRLTPEQQRTHLSILPGNACMLRYEDTLLPLLDLAAMLGLTSGNALLQAASGDAATHHEDVSILVLQAEHGMFGLVVGSVHDTEDAVLKSLHKCVEVTGVYRGATFMGDGTVGLILDIDGLVKAGGIAEHFVQHAATNAAEAQATNGPEGQFLTFTLTTPGTFAVPLDAVFRFEEFPSSAVKYCGDMQAIIYRDAVMPLIDLATVLKRPRPTLTVPPPLAAGGPATIRVFISQSEQRYFAFAVEHIGEIASLQSEIDQSFRRPEGTIGLVLIGGVPTTVVDIPGLLADYAPIVPEAPPQAAVGWALF